MTSVIKSSTKGAYKQGESNDCTVRALANSNGMAYDEAHLIMKTCGRADRKGARLGAVLDAFEKLKLKPVFISTNTKDGRYLRKHFNYQPWDDGMSLGKAIKRFNKGRYIALVDSHVVALVDGALIDTFDNRSRQYLRALFEVRETFEQTVTDNS